LLQGAIGKLCFYFERSLSLPRLVPAMSCSGELARALSRRRSKLDPAESEFTHTPSKKTVDGKSSYDASWSTSEKSSPRSLCRSGKSSTPAKLKKDSNARQQEDVAIGRRENGAEKPAAAKPTEPSKIATKNSKMTLDLTEASPAWSEKPAAAKPAELSKIARKNSKVTLDLTEASPAWRAAVPEQNKCAFPDKLATPKGYASMEEELQPVVEPNYDDVSPMSPEKPTSQCFSPMMSPQQPVETASPTSPARSVSAQGFLSMCTQQPLPDVEVMTLYEGDEIELAGLNTPRQHCPHFPRITDLLPPSSPFTEAREEMPGLNSFVEAREARARRTALEEWRSTLSRPDMDLDLTQTLEQEDRAEAQDDDDVMDTFLMKVDIDSNADKLKQLEAQMSVLKQDTRAAELRGLRYEAELVMLRDDCARVTSEGTAATQALMALQADAADRLDQREKLHQQQLAELHQQLQDHEGAQDDDMQALREELDARVGSHVLEIDALRKEAEQLDVDVKAAHLAMSATLAQGAKNDMLLDECRDVSDGGSTRSGCSATWPMASARTLPSARSSTPRSVRSVTASSPDKLRSHYLNRPTKDMLPSPSTVSLASGCSVNLCATYKLASVTCGSVSNGNCFEYRHFGTYSRAEPKKSSVACCCPMSRALSRFITSKPGFRCDTCSGVQALGSMMFGCRQCDYDLCQSCYQVSEDLEGEPEREEAKPVEVPVHIVPRICQVPVPVEVVSNKSSYPVMTR